MGASTQSATVKSQDMAKVQPSASVACLAAVQHHCCVLSQGTGDSQPLWGTGALPWAVEHSAKPGWHRAAVQVSCLCPVGEKDSKEEIPGSAILFRAQLVFVIP